MMHFVYLTILIGALCSMVLIDWRFRVAFFYDIVRTLWTVLIGFVVFVLWDILGIGLGIFFSGHSPYMSGIYIGPEFPIEEVLFLLFLCYFTLVLYRLGERAWPRT